MARRIVLKRREPDPDALTPTQPATDNSPVFVGGDTASEDDITTIQQRARSPGISLADAVSAFSTAVGASTVASDTLRASNNSPRLSNLPRESTEVFSRREVRQAIDGISRNQNVFTLSLESIEIDRSIRDLPTTVFLRFMVNGEGYNLEILLTDHIRSSRDSLEAIILEEGAPVVRRAMAEILNMQLMPQMLRVITRAIAERARR